MKKILLMVAFTLTATTVFAHQDETGKGGAEQKAQKEQNVQENQSTLQKSETQAKECHVQYQEFKASCTYCDCAGLLKMLVKMVKEYENREA
jgi:hypothetical protein